MVLFKEADRLHKHASHLRKNGKTIGFVPTMGALHEGHLSLIRRSRENNEFTVCSIFVNPTQFNNADDLKHYPVTIEKDILALENAGCDLLFLPTATEIYPAGFTAKTYALGHLEHILEGKYRPGHFQGVSMVIERLLEIVEPHILYLGQKDYQQCMVVKKLLKLLGKDHEIKLDIAPTVREADGLAMSSRNLRLKEKEKTAAAQIFLEMEKIRRSIDNGDLLPMVEKAKENLGKNGFTVDYVEIADAADLSPSADTSRKLVVLVAASIDGVRLIDNLLLN